MLQLAGEGSKNSAGSKVSFTEAIYRCFFAFLKCVEVHVHTCELVQISLLALLKRNSQPKLSTGGISLTHCQCQLDTLCFSGADGLSNLNLLSS